MIQQRLATAIEQHNWFTVFVEVLIVVVGIFIGLQVDHWNNARKDRETERLYLERIHSDLTSDITSMQSAMETAARRREMGKLLLRALDQPELASADPTAFMYAIERANYTYSPSSENDTFEELKYSGELQIISSAELRASLTGYYRKLEEYHQWNFLRAAEQTGYNTAKLGILTADQVYAVNNGNVASVFTPDEALEALERIRSRPEFVQRIPSATHHLWEEMSYATWKDSAVALRDQISAELGRSPD